MIFVGTGDSNYICFYLSVLIKMECRAGASLIFDSWIRIRKPYFIGENQGLYDGWTLILLQFLTAN